MASSVCENCSVKDSIMNVLVEENARLEMENENLKRQVKLLNGESEDGDHGFGEEEREFPEGEGEVQDDPMEELVVGETGLVIKTEEEEYTDFTFSDPEENIGEEKSFHCDNCKYKTLRVHDLKRHRKTRHGIPFKMKRRLKNSKNKVTYPCGECEYIADGVGSLIRHRNTVHTEVKYTCDKCHFVTTTAAKLDSHLRKTHENYTCNECDYVAKHSGSLKHHIQAKHKGVRFSCDECGISFTTVGNLNQHKKSKHEGVRFPCGACNQSYKRLSELKRHIWSKHEGSELAKGFESLVKEIEYACRKCDYVATDAVDIIQHKESQHENSSEESDEEEEYEEYEEEIPSLKIPDLFDKDESGSKGNNETPTEDITKFEEHRPIKRMKFNLIGSGYSTEGSGDLEQHKQNEHGRQGIPFNCKDCDFVTTTSALLGLHIKMKHAGLKSLKLPRASLLKCKECIYEASSPSNFKWHQETSHSGGTRFPCIECDLSFTTYGNLNQHMKSKHIGVRYPCDQCTYSATRTTDLRRHKKAKHTYLYT